MATKEFWENLDKAIDEDLKNPNGYWNTLIKQKENQEKRYDKFEKWLEANSFNTLLEKLIVRNGDERHEWCHKKGYQYYGTPMLQFICEYVSERLEPVNNELLDNNFSQGTWFFKGFWFELFCGQGCFWRIYDADLNIVIDA